MDPGTHLRNLAAWATEQDVLKLKNELANWLVSHICGVDVKLRECKAE